MLKNQVNIDVSMLWLEEEMHVYGGGGYKAEREAWLEVIKSDMMGLDMVWRWNNNRCRGFQIPVSLPSSQLAGVEGHPTPKNLLQHSHG